MKTSTHDGYVGDELSLDQLKGAVAASSRAKFPMPKKYFLREVKNYLPDNIIVILEQILPETELTEEQAFAVVADAKKKASGAQ
ncbi:MAG: hypothetical protein WC250_03110 [Candidatus Paceibacterota bacterium]|jgi:hypothetical protein